MRLTLLALFGLALASSGQAQDAPSPRSTYVVPSHPGEPVRVTEYARRPPLLGRLSQRYRGLRANRAPRAVDVATRFQAVTPLYRTPRGAYARRGGSFFPVAPR